MHEGKKTVREKKDSRGKERMSRGKRIDIRCMRGKKETIEGKKKRGRKLTQHQQEINSRGKR